MQYGMLLWPHANSRYFEAVKPVAMAELSMLCGCAGEIRTIAGCEWIVFETDDIIKIKHHAHMYLVCELHENGMMLPVLSPAEPYLGRDLGGILKYKGKTNEVFTRFLLNAALSASFFKDRSEEVLDFLDPMCGKGTALFEAANRGWNSVGIDMDRADITEGSQFFKKYLEYHKFKHTSAESARTVPKGGSIRINTAQYAATAEEYKARNTRSLVFICADAANALSALPKAHFHIAAADLPYGVQHAPGGKNSFENMLKPVLKELFRVIRPGGAIAFAFNVNTLKRETVLELCAAQGFTPITGGPYEQCKHWVEQAVTRDIAVCVRP